MKIGDLSWASGIGIETLRYYERIGLIPPAGPDKGAVREYGPEMLPWLAFLDQLRITGMPIGDRLAYARLHAGGSATARPRRALLAAHREVLKLRIAEFTACLDLLDETIAPHDADIER